MKACEIVRETLGSAGTVDELTATLHEQAKEVLGYTCAEKSNADPESTLRGIIGRLGIEVLNRQSVLKYQAEAVAEAMIREDSISNFDWSWRSDPAWGRVELHKYTKPIPDFVIERAIQIKKECPQVGFWVEELGRQPDPFLIAHIGSEGYYIAVWEEARFEAGL